MRAAAEASHRGRRPGRRRRMPTRGEGPSTRAPTSSGTARRRLRGPADRIDLLSPVPPPARTPCRRRRRSPWLVERSRLLPRILCDPASCMSASADTRCWPRAPTSPMTPTARRCVSCQPNRRPRARPGGGRARASTSRAAITRPRPSSRPRRSMLADLGTPQGRGQCAHHSRCGCRLALGGIEAAGKTLGVPRACRGNRQHRELPDPSVPRRGPCLHAAARRGDRDEHASVRRGRAAGAGALGGISALAALAAEMQGAGRWSDADAVLRRMERVGISGYTNTFHWVPPASQSSAAISPPPSTT